MINKIKKMKRVVVGKDFFFKPTIKVDCKKYGSDYGGWWIIEDKLHKKKIIVFSVGLGEDISFDIEMLNSFNSKVYGFDPTPKSIRYVESLKLGNQFKFMKYAISNVNSILNFSLPKNENHVSGSLESIESNDSVEVECKSLQKVCDELQIKNIDILKMDIEGSEYKVIEHMIENKIFPEQLLVEYHHFFDNINIEDTKNSINLLIASGYELFKIDGYNYSFIKNK